MAYIGRTPEYGAFEKQSLTADGSTTTFSLNYTVGSSSSIIVSVAGVLQEPESAYNIASGGASIVFTAAPESSATVFVVFLGQVYDAGSLLSTSTFTGQTEIQFSNLIPATVTRSATGDGSTTGFTVTSGVTVNSVLVTENGVLQKPTTDYTVSSTTLTFAAAPAAGVQIVIRELPA